MVQRAYDSYGAPIFRVGDIVSRDGSDRHRVIEVDNDDGDTPLTITVECIKEPATDALSPVPWTRLGDTEFNLARRYDYADDAIDDVTDVGSSLSNAGTASNTSMK